MLLTNVWNNLGSYDHFSLCTDIEWFGHFLISGQIWQFLTIFNFEPNSEVLD